MTDRAEKLSTDSPARKSFPRGDLLKVLEERVARLVERHREAKQETQELSETVAERDRQIRELSKRLEASDRLRADVRKRIASLIAEVDKLQHAEADDARSAHA